MTRSEKILVNSGTGLLLELVTFMSGIVLPRMIIGTFGSEANGLVTSITQFLAYLTLLESGVGGVVKASLYKPLENKNSVEISGVVKSTENFFKKLALITVIYLVILSLVFPIFISSFDMGYIVLMIMIVGMSTVAQYLFGITYLLVLRADQKVYIYNVIQIITVIANLTITAILIKAGSNLHVAKLASGVIFVIRPIVIHFYVKKYYGILTDVEPNNEAIKQRWHGVGFSLASFVHKKTDVFLLTIFSNLTSVSVYAVYSNITNGINSLISSLTNSFQAAFGNMLARDEKDNLVNKFNVYVLISNIIVVIVFSVTLLQIIPFVTLYTRGITNDNYIQPVFSAFIVLAEMVFCLRQPYQAIITAAGHYKQTSRGAYVEAIVNIVISIVLIKPFGLVGIAIGTFVSMIYRTIDYALYLRNNILELEFKKFLVRNIVTIINMIVIIIVGNVLPLNNSTWLLWIVNSMLDTSIAIVVTVTINYIMYPIITRDAINVIKWLVKRKRRKK